MTDWNPTAYLSFAQERARPAADLIARLPNHAPQVVHDLGCGPGNSTTQLQATFPKAMITGIDASPAMIERARRAVPGVAFSVGDVSTWQPDPAVDLIFSNALFQWVPQHGQVLQRLLGALKPGATLALQMPDNRAEPSHALMPRVMAELGWKAESEQALASRSSLLSATGYYDLLKPHATYVDIWRTTYQHVLEGHQGIVNMLSTTGLKPFLEALPAAAVETYVEAYKTALSQAYPLTQDGKVLFPFPRLFIVAVK